MDPGFSCHSTRKSLKQKRKMTKRLPKGKNRLRIRQYLQLENSSISANKESSKQCQLCKFRSHTTKIFQSNHRGKQDRINNFKSLQEVTLKNSYTQYSDNVWFIEYWSAMNLFNAERKLPKTENSEEQIRSNDFRIVNEL